jgi:hypothetical protein
MPVLSWMLQGGGHERSFGVMYFLQPTEDEYLRGVVMGLCFSLGLVATLLRPRYFARPASHWVSPYIPRAVLVAAISLVLVHWGFLRALTATGVVPAAESYTESYLVIRQLPLGLRQLLKFSSGVALFAKLVVLTWLFQNWRRNRAWIALLLAVTVFSTDIEGERTSLFVTLFACLILWARCVKPLSGLQLLSIAILGILMFTALGIYRTFSAEISEFSLADFDVGEFDNVFANAIILGRELDAGRLDVPLALHFSELYGAIPAVLLPFEKLRYADWYVEAFHGDFKDQGGGLAFGVFSQLTVGYGVVEGLIRGFVLGSVLNALTKRLANNASWWRYPALLYLAVWMFNVARDSSFSFVTQLIQIVPVAVVAIAVLAKVLAGSPVAANDLLEGSRVRR